MQGKWRRRHNQLLEHLLTKIKKTKSGDKSKITAFLYFSFYSHSIHMALEPSTAHEKD
jgi:hypothetical protein